MTRGLGIYCIHGKTRPGQGRSGSQRLKGKPSGWSIANGGWKGKELPSKRALSPLRDPMKEMLTVLLGDRGRERNIETEAFNRAH